MEFSCTGCGKTLRASDEHVGKKARCPNCGVVSPISAIDKRPPRALKSQPEAAVAKTSPAGFATPRSEPIQQEVSSPYATPTSFTHSDQRLDTRGFPASRSRRFVGAILDWLIHGAGVLPGYFLLSGGQGPGNDLEMIGVLMLGGGLIVVAVVNWVLIGMTGQSYGKYLLGMRIVDVSSGRIPGFPRGVILRLWVPSVANQFCCLFGFIDGLFIFGEQRQCLHDMIANTRVDRV